MLNCLRTACFVAAATIAGLVGISFGPSPAAQDGPIQLAQRPGGGFQGKGFRGNRSFQGNGAFRRGGQRGGGAPGVHAERSVPYSCRRVCSGYGVRTRCDGSRRSARYPVHRGIDIHIPVGTPLLAIANGEIVGATTGASIGGIGLVIRHPPGTVSQSKYVYAVYKHLRSRSPLGRGTKVRRGQRVATSGKSGTAGPYFGPGGFSQLHFETRISDSANWPTGKLTSPLGILKGHGWPIACR